MHKNIWWALVALIFMCCKKTMQNSSTVGTHPGMLYKNLADSNISFGNHAAYDVDDDGITDVLFSTQLVGDPIEKKDKKQWMVTTAFHVSLPVNILENIPVLRRMDTIPLHNFSEYKWYNACSIVLCQKTIVNDAPPYWEGGWKNASHAFIPIKWTRQDGLFTGWIEISFDTDHQLLILHKAAICKEANSSIIAGR